MTSPSPRPPASIYVTGLFAMGYTDFYIFLIPLYGLSLGMSAGEIGALVGGALPARGVSVDPYRQLDGPVRHAPGDLVLCLDGDGVGAGFSAGAVVLAACCCCRSSMAARCPLPGRARRP